MMMITHSHHHTVRVSTYYFIMYSVGNNEQKMIFNRQRDGACMIRYPAGKTTEIRLLDTVVV